MKCDLCGANSMINYGNSESKLCEKCSKTTEGIELTKIKTAPTQNLESKSEATKSNYGIAQKITSLMEFIGWGVIGIGGLIVLIGILGASQDAGFMILGLLSGLATAVSGLFLIAGSQITKAMVDNADYTREILTLMKNRA
ncbi:hypothetical protein [Desulfoluna spongiiphila]|uniref:Uncharacterized protein n=1 Tax=Desulfoluna spongiiphila TaxID=419481 RepID=A0A1G5GZT4_9BACT|nr:hypothetical protein [Desulfoluna spongiiphila]SCY56917.1 hypothetical protein SAMN05216233_11210 [Desulfoluna spongiiphila]